MSAQQIVAYTLPSMPALIPGFSSRDPVFLADMATLWQVLATKWEGGASRLELTESVRAAMRAHPAQHPNILALASWFAYINDTNGLGELEQDWSGACHGEPSHISNLLPEALAGLLTGSVQTQNDDQPPF